MRYRVQYMFALLRLVELSSDTIQNQNCFCKCITAHGVMKEQHFQLEKKTKVVFFESKNRVLETWT